MTKKGTKSFKEIASDIMKIIKKPMSKEDVEKINSIINKKDK